jgi:hypothetical protein
MRREGGCSLNGTCFKLGTEKPRTHSSPTKKKEHMRAESRDEEHEDLNNKQVDVHIEYYTS